MYSALMLSELVEARYAARLAEAERRRRVRELSAARAHRLRSALRHSQPHLPRLRRPRLRAAATSTTCATAR